MLLSWFAIIGGAIALIVYALSTGALAPHAAGAAA